MALVVGAALFLPRVEAGCWITPVNGHVNVPPGTTSIAKDAFYGCSALVSVTVTRCGEAADVRFIDVKPRRHLDRIAE